MATLVASVPDSSSNGPLGLLQGYARGGDSRLRRAVGAAVTVSAVVELSRSWIRNAQKRLVHTVTLSQEDDVYTEVHAWILDNLPSRRQRSLKVRTRRISSNEPGTLMSPDEMTSAKAGMNVYYDGTRACTLRIDQHIVRVEVVREDMSGFKSFEDLARMKPERIVFTCRTEAGRDAVLGFIQTLADTVHSQKTPRLHIATSWGEWRRMEMPPRNLDTVILTAGQRDSIAADVERFLGEEAAYVRLGLPWHRGYLFHGPPGTGKTSLAKALAGHFGLDLYYLPLSDVKEDTRLLQLVSSVPQRAVLVLEDIDVVHATGSRDDAESAGISLSGLLNALDGLATPHGLITVMTTNDLKALDPALIRPGRADVVQELGYLDDKQLFELVLLATGLQSTFGNRLRSLRLPNATITHAEVLEVIKRHLDSPDDAYMAVVDFLNG